MNAVPLRIRYTRTAQRPAAAWLLLGDDPADWLRTLAACGQSQLAVQLRMLPISLHDNRPQGALVTFGSNVGSAVEHPSGGVAYGLAGKRLYLPVEATLDPAVGEAELAAMLSPEHDYVWHPLAGLIAFEAHEVLRIGDLMALGPRRKTSWNAAQPGVALASRLLSLEPAQSPTLDEVIEESRGDIGSRSDEMETLPRSEQERPPGPLSSLGAMGLQAFAQTIKFFANFAPSGAASPTWINDMQEWATRTLGGIAAASLANRFKELNRLMAMLEQNPDEGLKFALPLAGEASRGLAPPSDQLGRRDVNFRLGALGGGRAADYWDVPRDLQLRLSARYRELAMREMRLGRYRRAAYIYAQLLYDLSAAAAALTAGEHWREAAVIYRDKLNRPLDAAKALEQGGLWSEAIALYVELHQYEKAGDLHARLEQHDEAAVLFRREVERLLAVRDHRSAARVLEFKLGAIDDTIALLEAGWAQSPRLGDCLPMMFLVMARNGRHEQARRRVESLCNTAHALNDAVIAAETLSNQGENYPDADVRGRAAEATRVVVTRVLSDADSNEAKRLVAAITNLARHDRLLRRDGNRYLQQRPVGRLKKAMPPSGKIERLHYYCLSNRCDFRAATSIGDVVYAAGVCGDKIEVWRCSLDPDTGFATSRLPVGWPIQPATRERSILLAAHGEGDARLLVHHFDSDPLPTHQRVFYISDVFRTEVTCGAVAGESRETVAAMRTAGGFTWLVNFAPTGMHVVGSSPTSAVVFDRSMPLSDEERDGYPLPQLAMCQSTLYVSLASLLFIYEGNDNPRCVLLPSWAAGLATAPRNTRRRLAVAMEEGAMLFWDGNVAAASGTALAGSLQRPVIGFTSGGFLVAADQQQVQVYRTADGKSQFHAQFDTPNEHPVAVVAVTRPNEFTLVDRNGTLTTFRV